MNLAFSSRKQLFDFLILFLQGVLFLYLLSNSSEFKTSVVVDKS
tara:strand:- start:5512 stop:5643 length:132 start_codon:yes stop_codon:yes gene_type:complete